MKKTDDLEKKLKQQLEKKSRKKGIDPANLKKPKVQIDRQARTVSVKYGNVEATIPAPSEQGMDAWLKENGAVLTGAVIALAAVAVGVVISKK